MRAGTLNTPIEILKLSTSRNEFGEVVDTYDTIIKTRAKVVNLSASRDSINNETFYSDVKQLVVYMYVNINDFDHIRIKGTEYKIESIIPDEHWNQKTINISKINE